MVTATVNRRLYQRIVHLAEQDPLGGSPDIIRIEPPFAAFRPELEELLGNITVCHDPIRKLSGAFHEETGYGAQLVGERYRVVYRKPLNEQFDAKQVAKVVDPALRVVPCGASRAIRTTSPRWLSRIPTALGYRPTRRRFDTSG